METTFNGELVIKTNYETKELVLVYPSKGCDLDDGLSEDDRELLSGELNYSKIIETILIRYVDFYINYEIENDLLNKLKELSKNKIEVNSFSEFNHHSLWSILGFKYDELFRVESIFLNSTLTVVNQGVYSNSYTIYPESLDLV